MKVHMQPTQDRGPHLSADRSGHRSGSIRSGRAGASIDDGLPITGCLAAVEEPYRIRPGSRCPVGLAVLRVSLLGGEPTVAIVNGFYRPDARQHRRVPSVTTRLNGFAFGRVDTELEAAAPGRAFVIRKCFRRSWFSRIGCRYRSAAIRMTALPANSTA